MTELDGHAVVVTGGGRGLGAGIAEAVLESGGRVTLVDIAPGRAAACAERLDRAGERTLAIDADVRDGAAMRAVVRRDVRSLGRPQRVGQQCRRDLHELHARRSDGGLGPTLRH